MDIPSIINRNYYVVRARKTNRTWICEAERFDDKDMKLYFYYGTYELGSEEHKNNDYLSDSYYDILSSENDEIRLATMEEIDILMDILEKNGVVITLQEAKDKACKRTHEDVIFDSIIWHLRNSVNNGKQNLSGGECEDYFREVVKKNNENKMKNVIAELLEHIKTTPKEDLEREFEEIKEWSNVGPTVEEFMDFCNKVNKKPTYPNDYEECVRIAKNIHGYDIHIDAPAYRGLAESFIKLFICRDAYWKIYGEEKGLGKPWKPDWLNETTKYGIQVYQNTIIKDNFIRTNCAFVFPTPEIRDTFYENFKELIEECKELL